MFRNIWSCRSDRRVFANPGGKNMAFCRLSIQFLFVSFLECGFVLSDLMPGLGQVEQYAALYSIRSRGKGVLQISALKKYCNALQREFHALW